MTVCTVAELNLLYEGGPGAFLDSDRRRFLASVTLSGDPAACWLRRNTAFWLCGHTVSASRAAYAMFVGPVPGDLEVCHTCDVRRCARLTHLFLGTVAQNAQDSVDKGRSFFGLEGAASFSAKLSWDQVHEIRLKYGEWVPNGRGRHHGDITMLDLALEYGVATERICNIVRGRSWRDDRRDDSSREARRR